MAHKFPVATFVALSLSYLNFLGAPWHLGASVYRYLGVSFSFNSLNLNTIASSLLKSQQEKIFTRLGVYDHHTINHVRNLELIPSTTFIFSTPLIPYIDRRTRATKKRGFGEAIDQLSSHQREKAQRFSTTIQRRCLQPTPRWFRWRFRLQLWRLAPVDPALVKAIRNPRWFMLSKEFIWPVWRSTCAGLVQTPVEDCIIVAMHA